MNKQQRNAPKGQNRIAQGIALGNMTQEESAPCKGKIIIKRCCPYRAHGSVVASYPQGAALG